VFEGMLLSTILGGFVVLGNISVFKIDSTLSLCYLIFVYQVWEAVT